MQHWLETFCWKNPFFGQKTTDAGDEAKKETNRRNEKSTLFLCRNREKSTDFFSTFYPLQIFGIGKKGS